MHMISSKELNDEIVELRQEFEPPFDHYVDTTLQSYAFVHEIRYVRTAIATLWLDEDSNWGKAMLANRLYEDMILKSVIMTNNSIAELLRYEYHNANGDTMYDVRRHLSYLIHPLASYTANSQFPLEHAHHVRRTDNVFELRESHRGADIILANLALSFPRTESEPKIESIHEIEENAKEAVRREYMDEIIRTASQHSTNPNSFRYHGAGFLFLGVFNGLITQEDLSHLPKIGPLKNIKLSDRFSSEDVVNKLTEASKLDSYYHKYFHIYKLYRDQGIPIEDCLLFLLKYRESVREFILAESGKISDEAVEKSDDTAVATSSQTYLSLNAYDQAYKIGAITLEEYLTILQTNYKRDWINAMEEIIEMSRHLHTDQLIPVCIEYFKKGAIGIADIDPFIRSPRADLIIGS